MITRISKNGCLSIKAENDMEQYALSSWCENVKYGDYDTVDINMGSFNILGKNNMSEEMSILDEECDK